MFELTCVKCAVENRESLTCQACQQSFELRKVLKESISLREILDNKSRSMKYRDNKMIDLNYTLMNRELNAIKRIVTEAVPFKIIETMNLGNYEIFIETVHSESDQSWDVKVILHLPEDIAEKEYCSIKH